MAVEEAGTRASGSPSTGFPESILCPAEMTPACLHLAAWVEAHGGMSSVVRWHRQHFASDAVLGLFDRPRGHKDPQTWLLGARGWTSPAQLQRRVANVALEYPDRVVVYHNLWGVAWFAASDRAGRRIGVIHTDRPDFNSWVGAQQGRLDGIVCVTESLAEAVRELLPELAETRVVALPYPIELPPVARAERPTEMPWRLGYAGRLDWKQKRLDRIAAMLRELDARGLAWTFDFLGTGPAESSLRRQFREEPRIRFLGWRENDGYWRALSEWDSIVFCSDFEASPLALLEAMHAGVLPVFPSLGRTMGDEYGPQIHAGCVYPPGNMAAAADAITQLARAPEREIAAARAQAVELASRHTTALYASRWTAFVRSISDQPRISVSPRRPSRPSDFVPIAALERFWPTALVR